MTAPIPVDLQPPAHLINPRLPEGAEDRARQKYAPVTDRLPQGAQPRIQIDIVCRLMIPLADGQTLQLIHPQENASLGGDRVWAVDIVKDADSAREVATWEEGVDPATIADFIGWTMAEAAGLTWQ